MSEIITPILKLASAIAFIYAFGGFLLIGVPA